MDLSDLLAQNRIKKAAPDAYQARECIEAAEYDISTAKKLAKEDSDWAFSIAYNSMIRMTRAVMFTDGYSPIGESHHKIAVDYADVKFGVKNKPLILAFEQMRKKRHHAVYDKVGAVSEFEANTAISNATEFLRLVRNKLKL